MCVFPIRDNLENHGNFHFYFIPTDAEEVFPTKGLMGPETCGLQEKLGRVQSEVKSGSRSTRRHMGQAYRLQSYRPVQEKIKNCRRYKCCK